MARYPKHKPWGRQKALKKQYSLSDIPQIHELDRIISSIKWGVVNTVWQTKRAKALFAMYYLTACRASEITIVEELYKQTIERETIIDADGTKKTIYQIGHDKKPKLKKWKEPHGFLGTRKCDIKKVKYQGKSFLEVRIENRKNKTRKTKLLPIPISLEGNIVKYIYDYIEPLEEQNILFGFTPRRAAQIINETTGFNLHFIRHIRATHLITLYDFNEQMLIKYMGWTDSRPAKAYMELSTATLAREFYKNRGD